MRLYAHRGSSGTTTGNPFVENTVTAVVDSLDAGADGVEVDLRLSRDGVLVACHDADLRRLTGSAREIASSRWAELRRTCSSHGITLARAEDVLAALGGRPVVLELKQPPPGRVLPTVRAVAEVVRTLRTAGQPPQVTVSSFAPALLAAARTVLPPVLRVRTALLGDVPDAPGGLLRQALDAGHDEIHPHVTALLADPAAVDRAHALGMGVVPWTVNRPRELRHLADLGVDGVITDVPAAARLALAATRAAAA